MTGHCETDLRLDREWPSSRRGASSPRCRPQRGTFALGDSVMLSAAPALAQQASQPGARQRLNPIIELLEQKKAVFGLYAPRPAGAGGRGGAPAAAAQQGQEDVIDTPWEIARAALAHRSSDYIFISSMEADGLQAFSEMISHTRASVPRA